MHVFYLQVKLLLHPLRLPICSPCNILETMEHMVDLSPPQTRVLFGYELMKITKVLNFKFVYIYLFQEVIWVNKTKNTNNMN